MVKIVTDTTAWLPRELTSHHHPRRAGCDGHWILCIVYGSEQ